MVRMSDPERRLLALRLFGSGVKGEPHGPMDPQWVVTHLAGTRQTLRRWRQVGIPPDRLDEVIAAVHGLLPDIQKDAAPSMTRRLLAGVMALENRAVITPEELQRATSDAAQFETQALDVDRRLAAELAETQRRAAEQATGPTGGQSGASPGSKRSKR
jgi:hypothetical protein